MVSLECEILKRGFFYSNKERYIVAQKCTNIYRILFTQANICAILYV